MERKIKKYLITSFGLPILFGLLALNITMFVLPETDINGIENDILSNGPVETETFVIYAPLADSISVDNNTDFVDQAATNNWDLSGTRDGSAALPFVLAKKSSTKCVFVLNCKTWAKYFREHEDVQIGSDTMRRRLKKTEIIGMN